jgi:hypothetical protein
MAKRLALAVLLGAMALVCACSDSGAKARPTPDPADTAYVAAMCSAFAAAQNGPSVDDNGLADADRYVQLLRQAVPPADAAAAHGQLIATLDDDLKQLQRDQVANYGVWFLKPKPSCTASQAAEDPPHTWCYDRNAAAQNALNPTPTDMERSRQSGDSAIRPVRAVPLLPDKAELRLIPLVKANATCAAAGVTTP